MLKWIKKLVTNLGSQKCFTNKRWISKPILKVNITLKSLKNFLKIINSTKPEGWEPDAAHSRSAQIIQWVRWGRTEGGMGVNQWILWFTEKQRLKGLEFWGERGWGLGGRGRVRRRGAGDGGHLHCAVYFSPKSSITSRLNNPHPKNFIMSIATKPINIIRKYRLTSRYIPDNPCS